MKLMCLDFEHLLSCYPEKRENFVVEESSGWYRAYVPTMDDCDTSELIISCGKNYIRLNYISLPDCEKNKGYGTSILRELLNQCQKLKVNLWVSMACESTRSILTKLIQANNYTYTEIPEPVADEATYWDIYVYFI